MNTDFPDFFTDEEIEEILAIEDEFEVEMESFNEDDFDDDEDISI
jgi:hypothetical protein